MRNSDLRVYISKFSNTYHVVKCDIPICDIDNLSHSNFNTVVCTLLYDTWRYIINDIDNFSNKSIGNNNNNNNTLLVLFGIVQRNFRYTPVFKRTLDNKI